MPRLHEAINFSGDQSTRRLNLQPLRAEVLGWFADGRLDKLMGPADGDAERIAREWLVAGGKRWRPMLTCCTYQALGGDGRSILPPEIRKVAVAVECFHKASLAHDDIEDADDYRYGRETLHRKHGVPVALNVGDLLIGQGYRLISECGLDGPRIARMVQTAADAHRRLCGGQGDELSWARRGGPLPLRQVLDIFARKTSPSFFLALHLAAICAGQDGELTEHLRQYSNALGIAYQIRDDLRDFNGSDGAGDIEGGRLSVVLSAAAENADTKQKDAMVPLLDMPASDSARGAELRELLRATRAVETSQRLLETHAKQAVGSLDAIQSAPLKSLLRLVVAEMFDTGIVSSRPAQIRGE